MTPIDSHPVPTTQPEIDSIWNDSESNRDPPHVDTAHEEYVNTIAEHGDWHVFRVAYPFGTSSQVTFWNRASGTGFTVSDIEGRWHELVNVFAAIVDEEGDCREADYASSLRQSGSTSQRCESCGGSWSV